MGRIWFSYKKHSISFPRQEIAARMSVPLGNAKLSLDDREQAEAIFDIIQDHCSPTEIDKLAQMNSIEYGKLFTIDQTVDT